MFDFLWLHISRYLYIPWVLNVINISYIPLLFDLFVYHCLFCIYAHIFSILNSVHMTLFNIWTVQNSDSIWLLNLAKTFYSSIYNTWLALPPFILLPHVYSTFWNCCRKKMLICLNFRQPTYETLCIFQHYFRKHYNMLIMLTTCERLHRHFT